MNEQSKFDPIDLEIMWSRLIGIADDMWTTVLRTAVSTIIGAAQDFGCEILDANGHSVAHSNRSMPVFNMVMPTVVRAAIERFPTETMKPGDVYVTNDPWICAGHLDDIAAITPVFHNGKLVSFATTIAHATNIGGSLSTRDVRDLYEEGLHIPLLKLYDANEPNETAFDFIRGNVRVADMVLTDIDAQVTANAFGARRIEDFLREYVLDDLTGISTAIQEFSEAGTRRAINQIPDGTYENAIVADGMDDPIRLQCRITINGEEIEVDYAGTDSQLARGGLNCTFTYARAHTFYPLKCLLTPTVPANEGTFRPITVRAPKGSLLNCEFPMSVGSRTRTGWHIHPLIFGALEGVLPDRVQAGNGLMQGFRVYGRDSTGEYYNAHFFIGGGRGASRGRDGIARNAFPSSARNVPVEVFENRAPVIFQKRALRPDSAGVGQWRGAFGHELEFGPLPGCVAPVSFFLGPDRLRFPAAGMNGGGDGSCTEVFRNGERIDPDDLGSGQITLATSDERIRMHSPGGAGYGPEAQRDPELIEEDIRSGLMSGSNGRSS